MILLFQVSTRWIVAINTSFVAYDFSMSKAPRVTELLHLFALSLWFGCLATTSAAAAVLFSTLKELDPVAPGFMKYPQDHWVIIGGSVGARLFGICDTVQLFCAGIALATFGVTLARTKKVPDVKPWGLVARAIMISIAMGLVSYQLFILAPRMNAELVQFWSAAQAGEFEVAQSHRALFDQDHPIASTVMGVTAVTVLIAWFFGAFALSSTGDRTAAETPRNLQEPELLGKAR